MSLDDDTSSLRAGIKIIIHTLRLFRTLQICELAILIIILP